LIFVKFDKGTLVAASPSREPQPFDPRQGRHQEMKVEHSANLFGDVVSGITVVKRGILFFSPAYQRGKICNPKERTSSSWS